MGWRTAVAAAALVLAVTLAAPPLYESSVHTAALRREIADICPTNAGLSIDAIPGPGPRVDFTKTSLNALAADVPGVTGPVIVEQSASAPVTLGQSASIAAQQAVVLHRDGQERLVDPPAPVLTGHDALVPAWWAAAIGLHTGDDIAVGGVGLRVAGTYDIGPADTPVSPWCAQRQLFSEGPFGDPGNPVVLTARGVIDELHAAAVGITSSWALPVAAGRVDAGNVDDAVHALRDIPQQWSVTEDDNPSRFFFRVHSGDLAALEQRAASITTVIGRTIDPVEAAAAGACLGIVLAAGVLVGRQRRNELQLLVERGAPASFVARRVARTIALPVIAGSVAGAVVAWLGLRAVGPSPDVAPAALARAAALVVAAVAVAVVAVTASATVVTAAGVDRAARAARWQWVPWEVVPAALVVLSWRRLHDHGGVHLSGVDIRGGDALGQAFPVVAIGAAVTLAARPLAFALERRRLAGRRLPVGVRLGVRRLVGDRTATIVVVLAGAVAVGTFAVAVLLRDTASHAARVKADTFVGADLALDTGGTYALPAALDGRATYTSRIPAHSGPVSVDVLAIDVTTFADAAAFDGPRGELDALLSRLTTRDGGAGALLVGGALPSTHLETTAGDLDVHPVATVDHFPGLHSGAPLVVIDARVFGDASLPGRQIWVRRPPANVVALLHDAGIPIYGTITPARIFDAVSFLVVDWSFAGMQAFGLVIGVLVVFAQLLVVAARRRQREVAWVATRRMGIGLAAHRAAVVVELAVPAALAIAGGLGLATLAARLSAHSLDPRPELSPGAILVIDAGLFLGAIACVTAVMGAIGTNAARRLPRTDELEVVRGEQ